MKNSEFFSDITNELKGKKIPGTEVTVDKLHFLINKDISAHFEVWEVNLWLLSDVLHVDENLFVDIYRGLHEYYNNQDMEFDGVMIRFGDFHLTGGNSKDVNVDILSSVSNLIDMSIIVKEFKFNTFVYPTNRGLVDEKKLDSEVVDKINTVLQQLHVQRSRSSNIEKVYPKLLSGKFMVTPDIKKYDTVNTFYPDEPPIEVNYSIPHYKFGLTSHANKHYKVFGRLNIEDKFVHLSINYSNVKEFYEDHPSFRDGSDIEAFRIKCGKIIMDHLYKYGIILLSTHHGGPQFSGPQFDFVGDKSINRPRIGLTWVSEKT
jgi:hypothetical protein